MDDGVDVWNPHCTAQTGNFACLFGCSLLARPLRLGSQRVGSPCSVVSLYRSMRRHEAPHSLSVVRAGHSRRENHRILLLLQSRVSNFVLVLNCVVDKICSSQMIFKTRLMLMMEQHVCPSCVTGQTGTVFSPWTIVPKLTDALMGGFLFGDKQFLFLVGVLCTILPLPPILFSVLDNELGQKIGSLFLVTAPPVYYI